MPIRCELAQSSPTSAPPTKHKRRKRVLSPKDIYAKPSKKVRHANKKAEDGLQPAANEGEANL